MIRLQKSSLGTGRAVIWITLSGFMGSFTLSRCMNSQKGARNSLFVAGLLGNLRLC
jgi:hypothetical protein